LLLYLPARTSSTTRTICSSARAISTSNSTPQHKGQGEQLKEPANPSSPSGFMNSVRSTVTNASSTSWPSSALRSTTTTSVPILRMESAAPTRPSSNGSATSRPRTTPSSSSASTGSTAVPRKSGHGGQAAKIEKPKMPPALHIVKDKK